MQLCVTTRGIARIARSPRSAEEPVLDLLLPDRFDLASQLENGSLEHLAAVKPVESFPMSKAEMLPPIAAPGQIVIAGLNYHAHCREIGRPVPDNLMFAVGPGTGVSHANAPIRLPAEAPNEVDYEGEIAIVIGSRATRVPASKAWSVVAGLTPLNDVSARDIQAAGTALAVIRAKAFPTFKPFGPALATLDEFADPLDIGLRTRVNGELRQEVRSSDMVFSLPEIIETVTAKNTLEPGDVICTGTPGGVAHGGRHPYLVAGDVIEIEIEGLPPLVNRVECLETEKP